MTFADFIEEKGVKPLSLVFGVSLFTVYSWRRRGTLPRSRWDRLLECYPRLTRAQLYEIERASLSATTRRAA